MTAAEQKDCVVLGGGGHARVLIDIMQASRAAVPCAILDTNRDLWGKQVAGVPVLGGDELLTRLAADGVKYFIVGLGAVGLQSARRRLFELGLAHHLLPLTLQHPSAVCSPSARIGSGSALFPLAVVNADASVGANVIVNTSAVVEHDCIIGNDVHVAIGARLSGAVSIGPASHIGAGAVVREGVKIGSGAVVGAGAVVIKDVPDQTVVVGVPARILKSLVRA